MMHARTATRPAMAVLAAVSAVLVAGGLFLGLRSDSSALTGVSVAPFPGNPSCPSAIAGVGQFFDGNCGTPENPIACVLSDMQVSGIGHPWSNVMAFYYDVADCGIGHEEAVLLTAVPVPDPMLQNGVLKQGFLLDLATKAGPWTGTEAMVQSVGILGFPNYPDMSDVDYLGCGNVSGVPVVGWEGVLDGQCRPIAAALSVDVDTTAPGVQSSRELDAPGVFPVAIVLENPGRAVASFEMDLVYDPALIVGVEVADEGTALDDNPDANTGSTTWPTSEGDYLGDGWDCSALGEAYPTAGGGRASIVCMSLAGPYTLGDDESEGVLAEVTFQPLAISEDYVTLTLENVVVSDGFGEEIGSCNPVNVMGFSCNSGSVRAMEDGDGIPFATDNCPSVYNPDQTNSDAGPLDNGPDISGEDITNPYEDRLGDACDGDADNDGLPDSEESDSECPFRPLRDSDADGSLDGYEASHSTDPCDPASKPSPGPAEDADGDGLTDGLEVRGWGTDPNSPDTDGDGCDDDKEAASINADKQANITDVFWVARAAFSLIPSHPAFDVDRNGVVNLSDAILAARNSTLLEPHSPCP